jgi:glucose-6-phosphate 1-dehydrogenase
MTTNALSLVIFGATGDLTARKLIPALFSLAKKRRLPQELRIAGVARSSLIDDTFRDRMATAVREFAKKEWDEGAWRTFAQRLHYVVGDAGKPGGLEALKKWLKQQEGDTPGRCLYYFAVSPELYAPIANNLSAVGLNQAEAPGWRRLIIEKPFGRDLASARALNQTLWTHFHEDQIYRIDHYLGKETVQNILVFRFANLMFEPLWNYRYIDHVQITVSESVAVGDRGDYYDKSGVLRDMFQNHLLQVLALVAMEAPARYTADTLRNEKVKVFDAIPIYSAEDAAANVVAGQYAGYRQEKGVAPESRTPTFAVVRLHIDNWRWQGVPFFLRSGKALSGRMSEVVIQYRSPPHLMFPLPPGATVESNRLAMCIQPDEGIHLNFRSKVPDDGGMKLHAADMEFHYKTAYKDKPIPEAYEILLQDALNGDATLFMRSDEIERAWAIMDPIIAAAERPNAECPMDYVRGSEGPTCADKFLAKSGRRWMSLCRHDG